MARVKKTKNGGGRKPRLLPVVIIAAGMLLTVKVDALWQDRGHIAEIALAQTATPAPQNGQGQNGQAPKASAGQSPLTAANFQKTPGGPDEVPQAAPNPPAVTAIPNPAPNASTANAGAANTAVAMNAPPPPTTAPTSLNPTAMTPPDLTSDANCTTQNQVISDLAKRRTQLDQRSDELDRRGLLLKAVEQRIDGKIKGLQDLQTQIKSLLGQVDQQQQERLASLVHIYESMKPVDAAGILQQMDMPVLLQIMSRMRDLKAGPILAAMDPNKARAVTLALAEKQQVPADAKNLLQSN
ncbi:MAG TPA: hypothetical protein VL574_07855 [Stellaceae bacterium]|nr:hypothetical protein [Stellaceae bacterium]